MESSVVVFFGPFFGKGSKFANIVDQIGVKDGFTVHAVESFDISVLMTQGLPRQTIPLFRVLTRTRNLAYPTS
jgi:hypothetical protein